jgi:ribosomal-protein-alanine N-acetyltransferase
MTARLRLRQLTHDDAAGMMAIFGDAQVLRFLDSPPVDTRDKAIEMIDWLNREYEVKGEPQWGISLLDADALIGMCGVYAWDTQSRHVDIGYHVLPTEWGKGYATEAARAMVHYCFHSLDVHRIQADITEGNIASERVLLKCGFTVEGVWRESCWEHERFVNIKQFGLLRREYTPG